MVATVETQVSTSMDGQLTKQGRNGFGCNRYVYSRAFQEGPNPVGDLAKNLSHGDSVVDAQGQIRFTYVCSRCGLRWFQPNLVLELAECDACANPPEPEEPVADLPASIKEPDLFDAAPAEPAALDDESLEEPMDDDGEQDDG